MILKKHRLAHVPELRVDPSMMKLRFAPGCATHHCDSSCCRNGVSVDLGERDRIIASAERIQRLMAPQARDPARWFEQAEKADPDFPSGRAVRTRVVGGGCVFLDGSGRCVLQTASLSGDSESQRLKPFFCSAFPITIENGRLTLDRGVLGTSSRCCGPIPKGSESAFDACSEELDYVLGAEGLRELRSEVALFEAPRRRVAVLANDTESSPLARGDEAFECPDAADFDRALHAALREAGFSVSWHRVHLGNVDEVVDALDCDVVFNLCDGHGPGRDNLPGLEVLAALERRGLPYTGASAEPYALSISKVKMKELFVEAGVPTPPWQRFTTPSEPLDRALVGRSLIVKPEDSGGSAGIDLASIVAPDDEPALRARLEKTIREYGAALVEEYVDGRELTVGLLGPAERVEALPPVEVLFGEAFPPGRGIRTHHSKWDPTSPLYGGFELACPAPLTAAEERTAVDASRRAYAAIQGSGYGRVDLRLDARGVWVLEVNMNPSLEYGDRPGDTAMLPYAARAAGIEYPALLARMVHDALGGRVTGRLA